MTVMLMSQAKDLSNASSTHDDLARRGYALSDMSVLGRSPGQLYHQPLLSKSSGKHLRSSRLRGTSAEGTCPPRSLLLLRVAPPRPLRCWVYCSILVKPKTPAVLGNGTLVGPPTVPLKGPILSRFRCRFVLPASVSNRPADRMQADASFSCSNIVTDKLWMAVTVVAVVIARRAGNCYYVIN